MIDAEPNVDKWRKLYRQQHGDDPPARLVELKMRNQASVEQRSHELSGPTLRSIAEKIDKVRPAPTLKSIAEKIPYAGKPKRKYIRGQRKAHSISPREAWEILDAYDRGDKLADICAEHHCTRRTVRMIARRAGRTGRVIVNGRE